MGYMWVLVVAAAVGVAVYVVTLRTGSSEVQGMGQGFTGGASPGDAPPADPGAYVPVLGGRPDWQSRLTGFFGLAVAVVLGGAALAVAIVLGFSLLGRLIGG